MGASSVKYSGTVKHGRNSASFRKKRSKLVKPSPIKPLFLFNGLGMYKVVDCPMEKLGRRFVVKVRHFCFQKIEPLFFQGVNFIFAGLTHCLREFRQYFFIEYRFQSFWYFGFFVFLFWFANFSDNPRLPFLDFIEFLPRS